MYFEAFASVRVVDRQVQKSSGRGEDGEGLR